MIDVKNILYTVVLLREDGEQLDLSDVLEDLEIEEGENQWAAQAHFFVPNIKYKGIYISSLAKLNCAIFIKATTGNMEDEVFRGTITNWVVAKRDDEHGFDVYAYDNLFYMQKNEDNRYFSEGTGTKTAITSILDSWGIPIGTYNGPDVKHAKTFFKNQYISKMIQELLDDAVKKGAEKCCIKSVKGKVYFIPRGSNAEVYCFTEDENTEVASDACDMKNIVTRVKIVGKEDSEGRAPIEAVLDGRTEFGIHQRIYNRSEDDSLDEAKSAAQDVLKENGTPERVSKIEAPDVPFLRRWDKVYIEAGTLNGYFWVSSVTHRCNSGKMKLRVVPEGKDSNDDLSSLLGNAINNRKKSELLIDFGSIQSDMSLRTNTFPDPIPQSDYSVLRQLTLGETGTFLTVTANDGMHMHGPSGPHGHGHYKPSGMNAVGGAAPAPIATGNLGKNELIPQTTQNAYDAMASIMAEQGGSFSWQDYQTITSGDNPEASQQAFNAMQAAYAEQGVKYTMADFQKQFVKFDPQFIPEDPGVDYPSGSGSPIHKHPGNDNGSKHRHPADSREVHTHATSPESNHVHQVLIPETMRWLHPGDRVVVAWIQNEAVVLDIVKRATAIRR